MTNTSDTITAWLDLSDERARESLMYSAPYPLVTIPAQRTLATNALLRAALAWDDHTWECQISEADACHCGLVEKVSAQAELEKLLKGEK